ncbi:UNVERIFIED_CONTAM: hypothetical protein FKN15_036701 [Acipenser sinensis]
MGNHKKKKNPGGSRVAYPVKALCVESRMCPIAWTSPVRVQAIPLLTVDGSSQGAAHNWLSAALEGEGDLGQGHRAPAPPVVWPGACGLACKLPRAALSSDAVALRCKKKRSADGTRFGGQRVLVFATPESAQGWWW